MAKGDSKGNKRGGGGGAAVQTQAPAQERTPTFSKSKVDEYTKNFTTEQFTGQDFANGYIDSLNYLKNSIDDNAPATLEIDGITFEKMPGSVFTTWEQTSRNSGKNIATIDYQANRQATNLVSGETEYPVLQIGIRSWRTKGGKVKTEIIRDGYTNKTRFW